MPAMVEPDVIPDIESWVLNLPEDAAACEVEDCDEPAEWRGRQTCCNYALLMCVGHRDNWIRNISKVVAYHCSLCETVMFEVIWTKI